MNLFNRVVLVIFLLALLVTSLLTLVAPKAMIAGLQGFLDQLDTFPFYHIRSGSYWAFLGIGLAVVLLCLLLLWLELRRPRRKTVQLLGADGHRTEVGVKAITQRLQSDLGTLADVSRVRPKVTSRGRKVDVVVDVQVHPAVDLPSKTDEITQLIRQVIGEQMGAGVGKVRVNVQLGPERPRVVPEPELPEIVESALPALPAEVESGLGKEPEILQEDPPLDESRTYSDIVAATAEEAGDAEVSV